MLCKILTLHIYLTQSQKDWVFLFRQVPLESYTFYTRSGKLKTWVRIPPCRQNWAIGEDGYHTWFAPRSHEFEARMCPQLQVSPSWPMAPDFQSGQIRFTPWVRIPLPAQIDYRQMLFLIYKNKKYYERLVS